MAEKVEPCIECEDIWPAGTMSKASMQAYALLEQKGQVAIRQVKVVEASQTVIVQYLSSAPHEWVKQALGEARREVLARIDKAKEEA